MEKKKLKIELPHDPAVPLLGIYLKNAHCSNIYNSQDMETT